MWKAYSTVRWRPCSVGGPLRSGTASFLSDGPIYPVTHLALREEPGKTREEIDSVKRQEQKCKDETLIIFVFKNGRKFMSQCRTGWGC